MIFCGDINTAHREIDLARPRENRNTTGFLPEERAWMDRLVASGYVDTFRHFHPDLAGHTPGGYSSAARRAERRLAHRLFLRRSRAVATRRRRVHPARGPRQRPLPGRSAPGCAGTGALRRTFR